MWASPTGASGGSPVISMNGNQWVGPGHNTVFTDFAGQGVDDLPRGGPPASLLAPAPGFDGSPGTPLLTKRHGPARILSTTSGGYPVVRGGLWASATPLSGPAAQPGQRQRLHSPPTRSRPAGPPHRRPLRRLRRHGAQAPVELGAPARSPPPTAWQNGQLQLQHPGGRPLRRQQHGLGADRTNATRRLHGRDARSPLTCRRRAAATTSCRPGW